MAGLRGPVRVAVICLSDDDAQAAKLQKAAAPIPVIFYDGKPKPCTPIVTVYQEALDIVDAHFFVFAHQDVRGDIPAWVQNGLDVMHRLDVLAAIGFTPGLPNMWRNTKEPTTVQTCDECLFGFYKDSDYRFDGALKWTSYSHDLCFRAKSLGHRAVVVPNSIGHAEHKYGPWFVKQGFYQKEQTYVLRKWERVRFPS